ncbi:MAG: isoaspartyl peptidase/L-asparaginase [Kofleriaceae bacterium]
MILVHGGAGTVTPERADRLRAGVRAAAAAGKQILDRGASALDAVVAAVRTLEQDPEFGAGVGSALTRDGTIETCASVMDGATKRAGAVAAVPDLAAPVILARRVMEMGEHVVIAGTQAARFAQEIGMPSPPGSLVTPRSQQLFEQARAQGGGAKIAQEGGSVGAVARDAKGNFAAATSTGGTLFRRAGTVDDSSIPGIGTWADKNCAVSTSGGEALFRVALANNIALRIDQGAGIRKAVKEALSDLRDIAKTEIAGAIVLAEGAWVALQAGPAMPVAWFDNMGPNDALGFPI